MSEPKDKSKKRKIWGIVLIVIGVLAFFGSIINGTLASYALVGMDLTDIFTIILMIACVVFGIILLAKSKKQ